MTKRNAVSACRQANRRLVEAIAADDGVTIAPIDDAFTAAFEAARALYDLDKNKARALLSEASQVYAAWSIGDADWDAKVAVH